MMRRYGQTWDYWENHLTFPMLTALARDMRLYPTADELLAWGITGRKWTPPAELRQNAEPPKPLMGEPLYEP